MTSDCECVGIHETCDTANFFVLPRVEEKCLRVDVAVTDMQLLVGSNIPRSK
jgi:hypothetical protein